MNAFLVVGFRSILERRLGPLSGLAQRPLVPSLPPWSKRWVRRALAVEVEAEILQSTVELQGAPPAAKLRMGASEFELWQGLDDFQSLELLPLPPPRLERWARHKLIYWSRQQLPYPLPSRAPAKLDEPLALRTTVWPTPAAEIGNTIQPLPFMPRGRDLDGATLVGFRFAELHRGHEIGGTNLFGSPDQAFALRRLLPLLSGHWTLRGLEEALQDARVGPMVQQLNQLGLLCNQTVAAYDRPHSVTWLGHASVLVSGERTRLLVDPLVHPPVDGQTVPDPRALPQLDAVLITHGDNDHMSPNALVRINPETPIYLPWIEPPSPPHQVDMPALLRCLGFKDLRFLRPNQTVQVGEAVVEALPFDGEDWGFEQAQLTYQIEMPCAAGELHRFFFSSDSAGPPELYERLRDRVTLAFMGVSGAAEPMVGPPGLGYGNFYEPWIQDEQSTEFLVHTASPAMSARFVGVFEPTFVAPYAAGAPWMKAEYADHGRKEDFYPLVEALTAGSEALELPTGLPVAWSELADWAWGQRGR